MDLRDLTIAEYKEFIKGYQKPYDYHYDPIYIESAGYVITGGLDNKGDCQAVICTKKGIAPFGILATSEENLSEFLYEIARTLTKPLRIRKYKKHEPIVPESTVKMNSDVTVTIHHANEMDKQLWKYLCMLHYIAGNTHVDDFTTIQYWLKKFEDRGYIAFAWYDQIPIAGGVFLETDTEATEVFLGLDPVYVDLEGDTRIEEEMSYVTSAPLRYGQNRGYREEVLYPSTYKGFFCLMAYKCYNRRDTRKGR